jgi:hypothetical protein
MDHAHEDGPDRELLESTSASSEAAGEFWRIYVHANRQERAAAPRRDRRAPRTPQDADPAQVRDA